MRLEPNRISQEFNVEQVPDRKQMSASLYNHRTSTFGSPV